MNVSNDTVVSIRMLEIAVTVIVSYRLSMPQVSVTYDIITTTSQVACKCIISINVLHHAVASL